MEARRLIVNLNSANPAELWKFYGDVLGLPADPELGTGSFVIGETSFFIADHSELKGSTQEPYRVMLDISVDDVRAERERLEAAGVRFIRKEGREPWGWIISTFVDPDGNYVQLIEVERA
jgi:predicted enzyme related to lactoylglutathione lyase